MQRYNFFRHFLSWLYFISSVGCISFPQLAVFRFLSWLYSKSQGYIRYVISQTIPEGGSDMFGLNNGNKKISLKNKNLSDIF